MKIKPNTTPALPLLHKSYTSYWTYSSQLYFALHSSHLPTSSQHSQGATRGGPLKSRGPLRFVLPSCLPLNGSLALFTRRRAAILVIRSKTKDAHMLTKKVSTFEKSERLSFLTQKQKDATCHQKKWRPLKKLASFRFRLKNEPGAPALLPPVLSTQHSALLRRAITRGSSRPQNDNRPCPKTEPVEAKLPEQDSNLQPIG